MNLIEYYAKEYFGIKTPCSTMLSVDLLKKYLAPSKVLDVGCGQGTMVKKLGPFFDVYGCDIFPQVVSLGENFFFHNMEEKPTKEKFDSIYSIHVLEHVFDYISFLKNIRDSLKDNGVLFLSVPNAYSLLYRIKFLFGDERVTLGVGEGGCIEKNKLEPHIRFFGKNSLKLILEKNGFKVKEVFGTRSTGKKIYFRHSFRPA